MEIQNEEVFKKAINKGVEGCRVIFTDQRLECADILGTFKALY